MVVGLRDVPPSQLPFARAVMGPLLDSAVGAGGLLSHGATCTDAVGGTRTSDDGTHASWWQGPYGGDSEASYPLTAVRTARGLCHGEMGPGGDR